MDMVVPDAAVITLGLLFFLAGRISNLFLLPKWKLQVTLNQLLVFSLSHLSLSLSLMWFIFCSFIYVVLCTWHYLMKITLLMSA